MTEHSDDPGGKREQQSFPKSFQEFDLSDPASQMFTETEAVVVEQQEPQEPQEPQLSETDAAEILSLFDQMTEAAQRMAERLDRMHFTVRVMIEDVRAARGEEANAKEPEKEPEGIAA